jgi:glucose/arabinose dehydrogenase/PKD repeat protein
MHRSLAAIAISTLVLLTASVARAVPVVPANFVVENAIPGTAFIVPTSIAFLPDGRFLVTEKRGMAWMVSGGAKLANPVWSSTAEVLDHSDYGLLDVAVDPDFVHNHYVYFLYSVDPDSDGVDTNTYSFGRLARYQMSSTGDTNVVNPASRTILMGTSWRTGPLALGLSHAIGSLRWGRDGSLLVTAGEGADFNTADAGGLQPLAFGTNLADPAQDIGAFRAQDITNLNGKVLRINPLTGTGYASNPYYDGTLSSNRSKVWAYGLRNPFRFTVRPGTGVADPAAGNPGVLYLGDVGWDTWEEMDIVRTPGQNFGWPCYEGLLSQPLYQAKTPAHNGCGSVGTATNPATPTLPVATWNHSVPGASSPPGFIGSTSIGGAFYGDTLYPAGFRGSYFFADYNQSWMKVATVDGNNNLLAINDFGTAMDAPVALVTDPLQGNLYYVSITTGEIRRIRFTGGGGGGNTPPVAAATCTPGGGLAPLSVAFDGSGSFDTDGDSLSFAWTFGDGGTSNVRNPQHTFQIPGGYTAVLTVGDGHGGQDVATLGVGVGSPSPFPTTAVLDNFNRANGAMGPNWGDSNGQLAIASNVLRQSVSGWNDAVWTPAAFGPDQEAFVRLSTISTATSELDVMLKVQGASWTAGIIELRYSPATAELALSTYDPLAGWQGWLLLNRTLVSGDVIGARSYATGVVDVYVNGANVGTADIRAWPYYANGGFIGIEMGSATASRMDDFGGGTWSPSAGASVTVTSPIGGENWAGGTAQTIRWSASAALGVASIDLYYRDAPAVPWVPLSLGELNTGSFTWFVQNTPTTHARVRVLAHASGGGTGADSSHADFTISRPPGGVVPTTLRDFQQPGTQPFEGGAFQAQSGCNGCHSGYDAAVEPGRNFRGAMMSQAAHDPLFYACLAIAEQDAPSSGDLCIRCHAPFSWLTGRSQPTNGSRIDVTGRDGVSCDFCHRLVDPVYKPGVSPVQDQAVLGAMLPSHVPTSYANGQYVLDPNTVKRGPYADAVAPHAFIASSFHERSDLCGTCHEVSNPVFTRSAGSHYVAGAFDVPADSISSQTLLPLERTYSEWKNSAFPAGVYAPTFAGNAPGGVVSQCQDCHMRAVTGRGCNDVTAPLRTDLPLHDQTGGNAFMGAVIASLYPAETDAAALADGAARAVATLRKAALLDLTVAAAGDSFLASVRVTNLTGHKLPTGYPEGRRMWINVVARDGSGGVVYQSAAYDPTTGILAGDARARIYEANLGISPSLAAALGLPAGPGFHFTLNDTLYKDNRIPPQGFANAAYAAFGGAPVDPSVAGNRYEDGQNWDVANYPVPSTTRSVTATLYYQTAAKEYVEFLKAQNATNTAGQVIFDAWAAAGRSTPVAMASDSVRFNTLDAPAATPTALSLRALSTPFHGALELALGLPQASAVTLEVYDVSGRLVTRVNRGRLPAGVHRLSWSGRTGSGQDAGSGVYWAVVRLDRERLVRRVVRVE